MNEIVIETSHLTKYYGKARGIVDLNLTIYAGEIFGFIGPNGAGKSTTIRTLLGLIFPTSGSAKIFGRDVFKNAREIKKQVGYVPAEVGAYPKMDGRELLRYSAGFYASDCEAKIEKLADILALDLDRKILDLSRGNQKKVAIVQSLIHSPRLLILDEPTGGLDPLIQAKFFDILKKENNRGTTIFLSSHTLSEVQKMCRRVAIIKEGKIAAVEDIETLRRKQLRKIQIEFDRSVTGAEISCEGIINLHADKKLLTFMYSGNTEALLQDLVGKGIKDLIIEEPSLEEIFMHHYSEDEEKGAKPR